MDTVPVTVAELIAHLLTLPQDLPAKVYAYDDYQDEPVAWLDARLDGIQVSEDGAFVEVSY